MRSNVACCGLPPNRLLRLRALSGVILRFLHMAARVCARHGPMVATRTTGLHAHIHVYMEHEEHTSYN